MYIADNWTEMFERGVGFTTDVFPVEESVVARVVEVNDREYDDYYGYKQGEDEISVVFEVDGRFFQKTGRKGSYDEELSWDGPVKEVWGETETITVFRSKR